MSEPTLKALYEAKYSIEGLIQMLDDGIKLEQPFFQNALQITVDRLLILKVENQ